MEIEREREKKEKLLIIANVLSVALGLRTDILQQHNLFITVES